MNNKIAPSIVLRDGTTYEPPGWMWVVAFALKGCDWAVKEASTESFRSMVNKWCRENYKHSLVLGIEEKQKQIDGLLQRLKNITEEDMGQS